MPATAQAPTTSPPWALSTISHIDWNKVNVAYPNMRKQSASSWLQFYTQSRASEI